jgi:hypothetical protein
LSAGQSSNTLFYRVHTTLKNPGKPWKICSHKIPWKTPGILYYPWKTLENINDAKDKE